MNRITLLVVVIDVVVVIVYYYSVMQFRSSLRQASWLRSMLFNPASQSARRSTCNMIASLSQGEARQRQILDLLCGLV